MNPADSATTTTIPAALDSYSPERPLVLLTEYAPDATGGGAVILRGLLTPSERAKVVWLTLSRFAPRAAAGWGGMELLGQGSAGRKPGASRSLWLDATVYTRSIANEVCDVARSRNARALWLMMHGAAVPVAARLTRAHAHRLPVHLTVHDDPVGQATISRKYLALVPRLAHTFAAALTRADSVDTISGAMAKRYLERYRIASTVVHRGVGFPVEPSPRYNRAWGMSVGVIGSIYQYKMLLKLGEAVAATAARCGVRGRIVVVGQGVGERLKSDLRGTVEVDVTGHLDEAEAVRRLRECFLLYVNYPFGRRAGLFRETSFPTKVSTYALAARPLLVHMPADGSVVALTALPGNYATHWDTLNAAHGAEIMTRLWDDPTSHESTYEVAETVRLRLFDFVTNRATLFGQLNALVSVGP
jgi:hypothetical protein